MVNSPIKARGPGHRVLGRPQRVRDGRELTRERAVAADGGRRLRMAQLRQVDDRQPLRHRARAGRQPAGLLQEVLPARQCHARRGRQVRRGEGARVHQQVLRLLAPARSQAARHLHRGAAPGRRARGDPPPRRRCRPRGSALSRPFRHSSRVTPPCRCWPSILGSEPSGRLYKALVETKKAASVSADPQALHDPGMLEIMAEVNTKDLAALEKVRDVMYAVIDEVIRSGVTQEEVDRARQKMLKDRELAAADPNRIAIALSNWASQGDWRLYFINRDRLEEVTPAQVKEVAAKLPDVEQSHRRLSSSPAPSPSGRPCPRRPTSPSWSRTTRAARSQSTGESFDISPLAIEARVQRPDPIEGVKLALLPKKTRGDAVHVTLSLQYGTAENLKGKTDAASFLSGLMLRGTKNLTRQQIQDALDKNFARLGGGGGMGGRMRHGRRRRLGRLPVLLDRDQARQPSRRAGDPPPGSPRAHAAGERVRGHEERADRRPRARPSPTRCARPSTISSGS